MNNDTENENRKEGKEIKEASGAESYENEIEAMENSMEGSGMEEMSSSEGYLPPFPVSTKSNSTVSETELASEKKTLEDSLAYRNKAAAKEKWLSVTGRKPRSIPKIRKVQTDDKEHGNIVFFGDRRPAQVEKERKQRWVQFITDEVYKKSGINYGAVIREIRLPLAAEAVWAVRYHPNGQCLTAAYRNGGVQVRNPTTGEVIWNFKTLEVNDKLPIRTIRYYPRDFNKVYLGGATGRVQVFDLENGNNIDAGCSISQISNMDFSTDGEILAVGGRDGLVCVLDPLSLKVISSKVRPEIDSSTRSSIDEEYHRMRIYGIKCHPTETNLFATGGWDRAVKVWDVRTPGAIRSFSGPWICGDGLDIDGDTILTASWVSEGSLQLWNFSTGKFLETIPLTSKSTRNDGEYLYSAQFFKSNLGTLPANENIVAVGGSGFNEVIVVKLPTGKTVASFPAYKSVTALDTRGGLIAYGGKESLLRFGQVHFPKKF